MASTAKILQMDGDDDDDVFLAKARWHLLTIVIKLH